MGRHRPTDGPKGAGMLAASKPSGPELEIRTEEAWHWHGWQRGRDGTTEYLWKRGPFRGKNLVWTTELVRQNILLPRNISGHQGDRMTLGPEHYLGDHVTKDTRHNAVLIMGISDNQNIVVHQDDTLTRQLGQKSS